MSTTRRLLKWGALLVALGLVLVAIFWPTSAPAFASGAKTSAHQPGTFIHLATQVRPLAVDPPTCSTSGCNGTDPYATFCAGQSWDSWWVVTSDPVVDNTTLQQVGWIQLWWSQTCQTNWGRVVPSVGDNWLNVWTGLSNHETTLLSSNGNARSVQLYAPALLACTQASFQISQNDHLASGASGQFRRNEESCY